jgi:hypothetical protein
MVAINSQVIHSINYDDNSNELIVITHKRSEIVFSKVPKDVYEDFKDIKTPDDFFKKLTSSYEYRREALISKDEFPKDDPVTDWLE